jgi:hypothetical protein
MKCTFVKLASIIGLTLLSQNLRADTLVGPGGAFQQWTAAVLGPASAPTYTSPAHPGPYWNNFSGDGPTANIGWCLVGSGGCAIATPPGAINYYGTATGAAVQNMAFQNSGQAVTVSLVGQLTNQLGTSANPGYNVFGWYQINPDGTIGALTPLWTSKSDAVGQAATFTPNGSYGLYLENIQSSTADYFWFMNSTGNKSVGGTAQVADTNQHFAIFNGTPGQFFIGIDDTNNGNQDYNNMIIELANAPEPRTFALVGISLLVFGFFAMRRNRTAIEPQV